MTKRKLLTIDEARKLLLDIVAKNPEKVNPRVPGTMMCLYTTGENFRNPRRCIVGQLAYEQGWYLPGEADISQCQPVSMAARAYRWPIGSSAISYLQAVQSQADGCGGNGSVRARWGSKRLRKVIDNTIDF